MKFWFLYAGLVAAAAGVAWLARHEYQHLVRSGVLPTDDPVTRIREAGAA
jgi:hypothetical protein